MRKVYARSSILLINDSRARHVSGKYALGKIYLQQVAHLRGFAGFLGRRSHARSTTTAATTDAIETIALGIHSAAARARTGATEFWSMRFNTLRVVCCAAAEVRSVCHFGAL